MEFTKGAGRAPLCAHVARGPLAAPRVGTVRAPRGQAAAAATPERPSLPDLKHLSDLFFNLNDAISHPTEVLCVLGQVSH